MLSWVGTTWWRQEIELDFPIRRVLKREAMQVAAGKNNAMPSGKAMTWNRPKIALTRQGFQPIGTDRAGLVVGVPGRVLTESGPEILSWLLFPVGRLLSWVRYASIRGMPMGNLPSRFGRKLVAGANITYSIVAFLAQSGWLTFK